MNAEDSLKLARRFIGLPLEKRQMFLQALQKEGIDFSRFPIPAQVESEDRQALSYAQQRMWFLWQLDPASAAYNLPGAVRLKGRLSLSAIEQAFASLVARHETLRTVFQRQADERLLQVPCKPALAIEPLDLGNLPLAEREQAVMAAATAQSLQPFDLATGPLLRVQLLRLAEQEHVLLLTLHHIVSDGWSMNVLIDEFIRCYDAFERNQAPQLPALPIQYSDYALWQRRWLEAGEQARQLDYWREQLGDEHPVLELPLDFARPAVASHQGQRYEFAVPAPLAEGARLLARQQNVSLFTVLLAAFKILLFRYTGQTDLRVGVPIANRHRGETEGLIGLFVNTQVMAAHVDGQARASDLLQVLKDVVSGAQAHQDLPFERLVEALKPERSLSHTPLFQVLYNHQPQVADLEALVLESGLSLSLVEWQSRTTQFDLSLDTWEQGGTLRAALTFATDLFTPATIERMARHWSNLLAGMVDNVQQRVAELPMLDAAHYQQQIHDWNATASEYPQERSIHRLIAEQVERQPDALALTCGAKTLSYRQLDGQANQLAHQLIELGVGPEVRVGVAMQRSDALIVALLGVLKAGGAYVPLDPDYPADRVAYMLEDSRAQVLLTEAELLADLPQTQARVLLMDQLAGYPLTAPVTAVAPNNLAYVIYTSGSTGKPKGVAIAHGNVLALIHWSQQVYSREDIQGVLASTSVCFDLSVWEIFVTLANGGSLILARNALELPDLPARDQVRLINTVPSAINALQRAGQIPESVRIINLAGEPLKQSLVDRLYQQASIKQVYDLYGPSEDTTYSTWTPREALGQPSIGRPLSNTQAYLLDADLQPVPTGAAAELHLAGAGITRGYLGKAALTAEKYVPNPFSTTGERLYRTGDLTRYRADGVIEYVGRIDHQVKIRGLRIELGEIEARLLSHPQVKEALVIAQDGRLLVAYVVPATMPEDQGAFEQTLRAHLAETLPQYMLPTVTMALAQFPVTPNGKLDRKALPRAGEAKVQVFSAPQEPRQLLLAGIWQDILGQPQIGLDDNFFELGGDSIVSIQVVSRARQAGLQLAPSDLFRHQTLRSLAAAAREVSTLAIEQGPAQGPVLLTPVQRWFFAQDIPARQHWNQSLLLTPRQPIQVAALTAALQALVVQHDALRLRFVEGGQGWEQAHAQSTTVELWQRQAASVEALREQCDLAQASLDLQHGPLMRALLVDMANGSQRLLLVLHHLVVDGVSWRVLLEDLQRDYAQGLAGAPLTTPHKTSAYQQWAARLDDYSRSPALLAELAYWRGQLQGAASDLPRDNPHGRQTQAVAEHIRLRLDREHTRQLLQQAPAAYRTQVNDLLLAALARTICQWTGHPSALIQLEGHGREELFDDIDLTRTLGWFTSLYPLRLTPGNEAGATLKAIKEQLRQVPRKGIGYGVLRYGAAAQELAALAQPRITFNYLGQFDQQFGDDALFVPASEGGGQAQSPEAPLANWLSVEGRVYAGELELDWSFSGEVYRRETIQALVDHCARTLHELIAHCLDPQQGGATPSDFPLVSLDQAQLEGLGLPLTQIEDLYPLSPMQQGMLFHSAYDAGAGAYINQLRLTIDGLDVERFGQCWQAVLERHEVLRARFVWEGQAQALQAIQRAVQLPLTVLDVAPDDLDQLALEQREQGFDLHQAPLLSLVLVPLAAQRYELIYTSHHILMDGWSNAQLLGEVLQRYAGQVPAPVTGRYADYVGWLLAQDPQASEQFWSAQLQALAAPTLLANALPAPRGGSGQASHQLLLDASTTARLGEFARHHKVTFNTLLQAAWAILLQRYCGQPSVAFGATVAGRPAHLPGIEQQVGLFINTLPIICSPEATQSVASWLQQVQAHSVVLREHEHTPLYDIQRWAGQPGSALFDTLLVFENYPVSQALQAGAPAGLSFSGLHNHEQTSYPLTLGIELGETLSLDFSYARAAFSPQQIHTIGASLLQLLEQFVEAHGQALGNLSLRAPALERAAVQPAVDPLLAHQRIERRAAATPDALALISGDERWTYAELNQRANRLAHRLREQGVVPGQRVGLAVRRGGAMIASLLAILKAGAAYVPLDPDYPAQRLAYMIDDSAMDLLLRQPGVLDDALADARVPCLLLDGSERDYPCTNLANLALAEHLAYVIYTSGSTGQPKGVSIAHGALREFCTIAAEYSQLTPQERVLQFATFSFDGFVEQCFPPLCEGACLVLRGDDTWDTVTLYEQIIEHGVTLADLPAAYWFLLAQDWAADPQRSRGQLRQVHVGGEAMSVEGLKLWHAAGLGGVRLLNTYGPTEATVVSSTHLCQLMDADAANGVPIGRALPGRALYVLDRDANPLPDDVVGELCIAACEGLAQGYHQRAALTAERFIPDPFAAVAGSRVYRSGDLARRDAAAVVHYCGRIDHQVKIRGFRIELGEIESRLLQQPGVRDAVVLAHQGASAQQLVAYIVPAQAEPGLRERLKASLKANMPDYMVPTYWMLLDHLPLTPNGKLDRKALPKPDASLLQQDYVAPVTAVQQQLAAIWQAVLNLPRVGLGDNFFELGGDSILSMQVVSRARQAGLHFTAKALFEQQTIQGLASVTRSGDGLPSIDQGPVVGGMPLLAVQQVFFDEDIPQRQHWNQSVLLTPRQPLDGARLAQALQVLVAHHDALRLNFQHDGAQWLASHGAASTQELLWQHRVNHDAELQALADQAQASLDLQQGPLLRAVLFDKADGSQRLLVIIHHLVVDGVSWRVLLQDLQDAYRQPTVSLPAKTTAFKTWAEQLQGLARGPALPTEVAFWQALHGTDNHLPGARVDASLRSRDGITLDTRLDADLTRRLLQDAPAAYRTQVNDLLLTALARVITRWTGRREVLIQLEGHGREELFDHLDLTRTVGWFTSLFPVRLVPAEALDDSIKQVKEQLRAIPNRGVGFGALRYLGDASVRHTLAALPVPRITFNYLGQFDSSLEGEHSALFVPSGERAGLEQHPDAPLGNWLTLNGQVFDGELCLGWTFSQQMFDAATIQALADALALELKALIEHCTSAGHHGVTPSDFPLAALTQVQVDTLAGACEAIEDIYPLSAMQQGMLFHSLLEQGGGEYVNQMQVSIDGLEPERFRAAWQAVVDAHPILRTAFAWQGGLPQPVQVVHKQLEVPFSVLDWRERSDQPQALQALAAAELAQGFDLNQPGLLRLVLVRLDARRCELLYTHHHILMDGWSNSQLLGEVLQRYDGQVPTPSVGRYRDYIAWLQRQDQQAGQQFWRANLAALEEPTLLAQAVSDPAQALAGGLGDHYLTLDVAQTRRLGEFARQQKVTPNTLVQAAWLLLLQRYTGQDSVAFGATVAGRPADLAGIEQQVGLFINTLPVIASPRAEQTVSQWLHAVQEQNLALREHEHTPLFDIQRWAGHSGDALFDSLLVFENYPVAATLKRGAPQGLVFGEVRSVEQTNYPLSLLVSLGETLTVHVRFIHAHFSVGTIDELSEHFSRLLLGMLDQPELALGDLSMQGAARQRQVVAQWNPPAVDYPREQCIHQLFEAQAKRAPEAVALVFGQQSLTYAELNQQANQLAHRLLAEGVGPDRLVGIAVERGLPMIISLLAILKAGGAYVPLDPAYPADRLAYMMQDSGLRLLITQAPLLGSLPIPGGVQALVLEGEAGWFAGYPSHNPPASAGPDNLAYAIYTSGSTGKPKGVMVPHGALGNFIASMAREPGLAAGERILSLTTFSFDIFGLEIYLPLTVGACAVLVDKDTTLDPDAILSTVASQRVNTLQATPSTWRMLLDSPQVAALQGCTLLCGGEALADELAARMLALGGAVWNLYGPTETTIWSAAHRLDGQPWLGRPIDNTALYILSQDGALAPVGVPGELLIGGDGLARGYFLRPGLTAERFLPDPFGAPGQRLYRTGDLARYRAEGVIEYLGRLDHQVKIRGFRIELGEIEARIQSQDAVREAAVLALDGPSGPQLVGYVVLAEPSDSPERHAALRESIKAGLKQHLADYMVPAHLVFVTQMPLTPNGKLDRKALPAPDVSQMQRAYVAPASPLEQQLAEIWQQVLKVERIGLGDNFFDLGGHSLQVVVMLSRVRAVLGVDVAVKDFYAQDSLGALAKTLADAAQGDGLADDFDLIFDALDELEQENLEESNA
ncbi:non-ribosomal peptide synthase/polyketide synthase [Pseudomonas sp. WS 5059]|uniref:non-ribosomal peptide synthase/polyketide synthase n=1 Tax=Pseudomonas sp. WS 5059 TaxID=2717491 RepID=UPI0014755084|nr:non-ribosomal peptide synthase/polyketide synthase [Pseudomonas sp. WS 5059]NMY06497.1 non-ribosomal peptide synthase/polyketide synthase [Pseudomonas sp. WS 5059]